MSDPAGTKYDGTWNVPMQHGAAIPQHDPVTRATLFTVRYQQKASAWKAAAWDIRGPKNSFLVEESVPTDLGGGVIEWDRIFAQVPKPRDEYEDYIHTVQSIAGDEIIGLPIFCTSRIRFDYFRTTKPGSIPLREARVAVKAGNTIYVLGEAPPNNASEIVAENSGLRRWRGNIWERQTRFVKRQTFTVQI